MINKNKDYIFLGLQIALFVAYLLPVRLGSIDVSQDFKILFRLIAFMGLTFSLLALISFDYLLSPFPSPKKNATLKTTGVYKWSRHPIYTGLILFLFAWACSNGNYYQLIIASAFFVLIHQKARYEEQLLANKFKAYKAYKKQTRMFI